MSRSRYKKLAQNTIIFAVANFGTNVLRFIIVPFYTYYLTTDEYGVVDTLTTTITLLMPFVVLAIQEAVLRFALDAKTNKVSVLKNSLIVYMLGSIAFLVSYFVFEHIKIFAGLWFLFYIILVLNILYAILLNFARGSGHSIAFMIGGIVNTLFMLISNVVFLSIFHLGVKGYLYALMIGYSVGIIYLLLIVIKNYSFADGSTDRKLLKDMLKYSIPLIPTAAMWWIMSVSDRYVMNLYLGPSATGIYAVANKIPTIISMLYAIFQQAWQISAVDEIDSTDRDEFYGRIYDAFFRSLFLASAITILIIKPLVITLVSDAYSTSWMYAPFLIISAVFSSMAGFLGVNYVASKKTRGALVTSALGAGLNTILNFVLIPKFGIQGAVIATLLGYYSVWIIRATVSNGNIKIHQDYFSIHLLFLLNVIQSVILLSNIKYHWILELLIVGVIVLLNKKCIRTISRKIMIALKSRRKGDV